MLSFLLILVPLVAAALPNVDFERMGNVALVGAFAGLDLFQNDSLAFDPATSTLFSRDPNGALTRLASTNTGGRILGGCALADSFYFSGLFTSINGVPASNVASYSPSTNAVAALGTNGPNGEVETIYCDAKANKLWVGGSFSSPASAVAVWDLQSRTWQQPPFGGLSGAQAKVVSITTNSSDDSLFFAGSFVTSFGSSRILNGTNNPNVPFSPGATPFSSSLVPIPLSGAQIQGSPSTSADGFNSIQNILCPGDDGPGNTWFAADGTEAVITIRTFAFMSVSGIRLGNTFQPNHGTTSFSITTLPDNGVQPLRFVDPTTGENRTCTTACPLSSDSGVLYQDYLFSDPLAITGVYVKLSGFSGASAGLHILQLLSSGAFASSVDENNGLSCYAPNPSNTTRTGSWAAKVANTDIAGTVQTVLVAQVDVGTPSSSGPTFTWVPYVSAAGNYDINLLVPGCADFQDCAQRTSVKVVVFPGEGLPPNVMTIPQQNRDDATVLIYSGPILPSSPNFVTTVTMSLADGPDGNGEGGRYIMVADRVQLILRSSNVEGTAAGNSNTTAAGGQRGFGFLEWPRSLSITADGTNALPNTSITALDSLGFDVLAGLGGTTGLVSAPTSISAVAHHPSGTIYFGGGFSLTAGPASGSSNILAFRNGGLAALPDGGLDGPVTSLLLNGDLLFVGGSFRDTRAGTTNGRLRGIAAYDVAKNTWAALGAGLNGEVSDLGLSGRRLQVAGNFTRIESPQSGLTINAGGFATWDIASSSWVNSGGFTAGRITLIANGTSSQFVAGNVGASRKFGASGMIMLKNGESGVPQVTPIQSELGQQSQTSLSAALAVRSRRRFHATTTWVARSRVGRLFARQSPASALAPLPSLPESPAPAVLAGSFWKNKSTELTVVGGNFSFLQTGASTPSQAIAIYDPESGSLRGLIGTQLNGTVRAILLDGDKLYAGGEFTMSSTNVNGLAIYDLSSDQWDISGLQPLQSSSGAAPVVRSITKSTANSGNIIVAGSFAQAGSLRCPGICLLDISSKQWNTLGSGVQGEVATIAYAGDVLYAGGSLALSDNTPGNVLQYTFNTSTWNVVGSSLPGPVTALEVNNGNSSSIFAAGQADGSPFLSFWNGREWSALDSSLVGSTSVSQLTMVPLQDTHSGQGVIQPDRMLLVSGSLVDKTYGNVSSALYDGQTIIPYIVASSPTGSPGSVSSLFRSFATFSFEQRKFLAVGIVILISIAIAAGVVFLIALIGILWTLFSRKDDKLSKFEAEEDEDDSTHHRPSSLLEHINAATRTTILGSTSPYDYSAEKDDEKAKSEQDPFGADASNYIRADTPSDVMGGMLQEETSRPAHARYSFDGTGEGELPISAGSELEVLDDRDPAWWYARDLKTGREGVVPAAYLY